MSAVVSFFLTLQSGKIFKGSHLVSVEDNKLKTSNGGSKTVH